jgi:hypothetical protein
MRKENTMATAIENLWPPFDVSEGPVPPITILKQQASLLGRNTKNLLEAEVETSTSDLKRHLRHILFLVAPALNFYRHQLLEVEHDVTNMYPATIRVSGSETDPPGTVCETPDEFKEALKAVFAGDETKRVINSLLRQSEGQGGPRIW